MAFANGTGVLRPLIMQSFNDAMDFLVLPFGTKSLHCSQVLNGACVPPSSLNWYFQHFEYHPLSCLCASQDPKFEAHTDAVIFMVTNGGPLSGEYVAACAAGKCHYFVLIERLYSRRGLPIATHNPRPLLPALPITSGPPSECNAREANQGSMPYQYISRSPFAPSGDTAKLLQVTDAHGLRVQAWYHREGVQVTALKILPNPRVRGCDLLNIERLNSTALQNRGHRITTGAQQKQTCLDNEQVMPLTTARHDHKQQGKSKVNVFTLGFRGNNQAVKTLFDIWHLQDIPSIL
ncbi:hypothetical protein BDN71DRAFT_1431560 [Pleurotus eryngii]|uniref:Uncharacterized protein n=1 Tax=Pleurotus eryngii TaxID=5323 RepID=A0A9P6D6G8_PLEER|nr:hypothetical protein BDN71DRAFT_1431560 [Pleurotus eryngii]